MKRLAIVGAGGFGREVAQLAEVINSKSNSDLTVAGFFDDDHSTHGQSLLGYPVVGDSAALASGDAGEADAYVLAIGSGQARRRLFDTMAISALRPATLIHPSVDAHRSVIVGPGSVVCNGTALTVDIHIGPHVVVNLSSTIGHDVEVEAFTTLHPGTHISGNVHIGKACELGTGATVLPGIRIGAEATVGAGAVVTRDVPPGATVMGVPARVVS